MSETASRPGFLERLGRASVGGAQEIGLAAAIFVEAFYWTILGHAKNQRVRLRAVVDQMMEVGIKAIPIVTMMAVTIGVMLAIQGIHTLRTFGAESQVTIGIALSVTREFAPLITGILVVGRSGSAIAARLGTMTISQEVDALNVMGINPVRFLVAPVLIATIVMLPCLTFLSAVVSLLAAGVYVSLELGISFFAYLDALREVTRVNDIMHGLGKSVLFAVLIILVGVINGAAVSGGAEGVGRMTTRSVVQGIAAIVVTDMIFAFILTR